MILDKEAPVMLAGGTRSDEAVFLVLSGDSARGMPVLCEVSAARSIIGTTPDIQGMVLKFSDLVQRKAMCEDKNHLSRVAET